MQSIEVSELLLRYSFWILGRGSGWVMGRRYGCLKGPVYPGSIGSIQPAFRFLLTGYPATIAVRA
jgi:hypothetical protein